MGMKVEVKQQEVTKQWALYNDDCIDVSKGFNYNSIHFIVYSPPFSQLFSYSDDDRDMGNSTSYAEFFTHYEFVVEQHARTLMPGRIVAVHSMDLPTFKSNGDEIGIRDFPGDIIRLFEKHGFVYHSRVCVWKDPLVAAVRSHSIGLAHKQIVKDSAMCSMGVPDYVLAFRKPGDNPQPVAHPLGLSVYPGADPIPRNLDRFIDSTNPKVNKRSHWIWQRIASPVWTDIRQTRVLPFRKAKDVDDTRHICPLQLDVIERCMTLWSNPGDVVFSPFAGIGSEVYVAAKMGRKGVGAELKRSYYKVAVANLKSLDQQQQSSKGFSA